MSYVLYHDMMRVLLDKEEKNKSKIPKKKNLLSKFKPTIYRSEYEQKNVVRNARE